MNLAIKLPNKLVEKVNCFPLLHKLIKELESQLEEDDSLNVHLLSLDENIDVLNLLPFKAYYHELSEDDLKNVFSVHRACVNLNLENVDVFVSLTESLVDASIGKYLRAESRIGFSNSKTKWLLTKKVKLLEGEHYSVQRFEIGRALVETMGEIPNVYSRNIDPMYADWNENPYTVLNLDIKNDMINEEWIDFISLFTNAHFIICCSSASVNEQQELITEFIKKLPKKNDYKSFVYESNIDFAKLISYAQTFVSYDSDLVDISSYCGGHTFYICSRNNKHLVGPNYSVGEIRYMNTFESQWQEGSSLAYGRIFDEIYEYLDRKLGLSNTSAE